MHESQNICVCVKCMNLFIWMIYLWLFSVQDVSQFEWINVWSCESTKIDHKTKEEFKLQCKLGHTGQWMSCLGFSRSLPFPLQRKERKIKLSGQPPAPCGYHGYYHYGNWYWLPFPGAQSIVLNPERVRWRQRALCVSKRERKKARWWGQERKKDRESASRVRWETDKFWIHPHMHLPFFQHNLTHKCIQLLVEMTAECMAAALLFSCLLSKP